MRTNRILNIFVPVFLTIALFILTIHLVILPTIEKQMMDKKREMIMELTNSAWGILNSYEEKARDGELTREQAQRRAAALITGIRYGPEGKDYFWINDMRPFMVSHPYRPDLNGNDISDFKDPNGKRLFVAFVDTVRKNGAGYVDYMWQWKDDPAHIVPKISYVRGFKPWGWIVGTGIYVEDVKAEIKRITGVLVRIYLVILGAMFFLSAVIIRHSAIIERSRAQAQDKLKASMILYSTLIENVHDMVFMLDARGNVIFVNSFVCNHYNVQPDKIHGAPLCFFWCGDSITTVDKAVSIVRQIKKEFSLDCVCENNSYFLSIVPLCDGAGEIEGMICVARDITGHKRAERALRQSEEKYKTLIENATVGIVVAQDGLFKYANPELMAITGYYGPEILTKGLNDLLYTETREEKDSIINHIARRVRGEDLPPIPETRIIDKNGVVKWLGNSSIVIDWEGHPATMHFVSDITARKQAESALRESEIQLRALSQQLIKAQEQERKRLSRELHDELGQKLAGLKLEIAALKRKPELLHEFLNSADQLLGDVNTDLRRIYNALRPVTIDKLGLRQALIALINGRFEHSTIHAHCDIDQSLKNQIPEEMSISIYRILQEIITNTIKHSQAHDLSITLKKESNGISLETADNGTGFDQDLIHDKIGFGLLGIKERTRQHGGELRITSSPGNGVRISAHFPLEQNPVE
jgi:PAS domain S-box-containing protein